MSHAEPDAATRRLTLALDGAAACWLLSLPALRPWVWSGQPGDLTNLMLLVLLAAATATGLLLRGLRRETPTPTPWWGRPWCWGAAFLLVVALGCLASPRPAAAWTLAVGWALHLAAPLALWPQIRRHPHLVVAGLVAGLGGELWLLAGQWAFERPYLAGRLANDPALATGQRLAEQFQVRIASWRLEGTFLLANTLAAYLVLLMPLVAEWAWQVRRDRWVVRLAVWGLATLTLTALAVTGSKAGVLAALVAAVATVVVFVRAWRWRVVASVALALAVLVALAVPPVRQVVGDSAAVRLDYWRAAMDLVAERPLSGHGVEGFAVHYPRVKPPSGEETVIAHQETLQAAVDLGVPAALLLLVWWVVLLTSLARRPVVPPVCPPPDLPRAALLSLPVLLWFLAGGAGALHGNFVVYPGSVPWLWHLAFTAVVTVLAWAALRLPLPATWACWGGVIGVLLHAQADFVLHSMQVVGVLAWVACLGGATAQAVPPATPGTPRDQHRGALAALGVLTAVLVVVIASASRGEVLERARAADAVLTRLRLAESGRLPEDQRATVLADFDHQVARLVVEDGRAALANDPREALVLGHLRRCLTDARRFPRDHELLFMAVSLIEQWQTLMPERLAEVTPHLDALLVEWPGDLLVLRAVGEHHLRLARRTDGERRHTAATRAQQVFTAAVAGYPTHLPLRRALVEAADLAGDHATASAQRAEIARLEPLVHRDNR